MVDDRAWFVQGFKKRKDENGFYEKQGRKDRVTKARITTYQNFI
jgi:hypothetical protein